MFYLVGILSLLLIIVCAVHLKQKKETTKRIFELNLAYKKAHFRREENKKKAIELTQVHRNLMAESAEKQLLAEQLMLANAELVKIEKDQNEYIEELEKMMHMISHEIRQPITHLQGLSNLFGDAVNSSKLNMDKIIGFMKSSLNSLDVFTRDLTKYIDRLMRRRKEKS